MSLVDRENTYYLYVDVTTTTQTQPFNRASEPAVQTLTTRQLITPQVSRLRINGSVLPIEIQDQQICLPNLQDLPNHGQLIIHDPSLDESTSTPEPNDGESQAETYTEPSSWSFDLAPFIALLTNNGTELTEVGLFTWSCIAYHDTQPETWKKTEGSLVISNEPPSRTQSRHVRPRPAFWGKSTS